MLAGWMRRPARALLLRSGPRFRRRRRRPHAGARPANESGTAGERLAVPSRRFARASVPTPRADRDRMRASSGTSGCEFNWHGVIEDVGEAAQTARHVRARGLLGAAQL